MVLFFISLFLVVGIKASILDVESLEGLSKAKEDSLKKNILHHLCRHQIQQKKIPSACYNLNKKEGYNNQKWEEFIDKKCLELPFAQINQKDLLKSLKHLNISETCLNFLKQQSLVFENHFEDFQ